MHITIYTYENVSMFCISEAVRGGYFLLE